MESTMVGLFLQHYEEFSQKLRRRLRSDDQVNEVMQETFLRVERMEYIEGGAHNPTGYLFRMALNVAEDQRKADGRFLTGVEVDDLLHIADEAMDPARIFQARQDVATLEEAMKELTPRQRAILIATRYDETPLAEIAKRFGISTRMVGKEVKKALDHCAERLDRKAVQRFGPGAGKPS
jgi:RNA polymerase sigma-70 factor (ECF subfamily)